MPETPPTTGDVRVYDLGICDRCGGQTEWNEWRPGYCTGGTSCTGVRRERQVVLLDVLEAAESDHTRVVEELRWERDGLLDAVERLNESEGRLRGILDAAGLEGAEALVEAAESRYSDLLDWLRSIDAVRVVMNAGIDDGNLANRVRNVLLHQIENRKEG